MTRSSTRLFCPSILFVCLLVASAFAQRGGLNDPQHLNQTLTVYDTAAGTGVLIFSVYAEQINRQLDRQALVRLLHPSDNIATWQTTEDTSKGVFSNIPFGNYEVEVSAVGYLTFRRDVQLLTSLRPSEIEVILHRDPSAGNLDLNDAVLPPKARKQAKHAISLLKSNNLAGAQKQLDAAYKLSPTNPDLNFLLGYLYFEKDDFAQASNYLGTAVSLNPHDVQALTLLGRAKLERQEYPAARSALEKAIVADADNWLPHNLLAAAYLHERNYSQARDEAQSAIDKGKSAAQPAQLVLGQALYALGRDQEAIQSLHAFLERSPRDPIAPQVRNLIAEIRKRESTATVSETTSSSEIHLTGIDPLAAIPTQGLPLKAWQPPGIDDLKPTTASSVVCPATQVIEESGKRVEEFVADVSRFAAVEDLFHQGLDNYGIPIRTEVRKYNYVATISEPQTGVLAVDEYRANKGDLSGYPDQISSSGFAALALVFHPHMRDNFELNCEGLGDWRGKATWLVHFRQREDKPNHMHSYKVGNREINIGIKGRAWISAETFQILRMEAELVNPQPDIQLLSEHQIVEYGPVPFPRKNTTLWLPKSAEIYFDFRKHRYYRRHSFDHYMLYSIDSEEKRKEPKVKKES